MTHFFLNNPKSYDFELYNKLIQMLEDPKSSKRVDLLYVCQCNYYKTHLTLAVVAGDHIYW